MPRQVFIRIFAVFNVVESIMPFVSITDGVLVGVYGTVVLLLWGSAYGIWRNRRWGLYLILLQSSISAVYRIPALIAWFTLLSRPKTEIFYFVMIEVFWFCLSVVKLGFFATGKTRRLFLAGSAAG